jgi:hypothetical protein
MKLVIGFLVAFLRPRPAYERVLEGTGGRVVLKMVAD